MAAVPPQVPVLKPSFQETTSLGAAIAAGLAAGMWTEADVFSSDATVFGSAAVGTSDADNVASMHGFMPTEAAERIERRYRHWRKAVSRALDLADLADDEPSDGDGDYGRSK